jgi:hypothetical protein
MRSTFLKASILAMACSASLACSAPAFATVATFEGLADSTLLTNQIAGVTFANAYSHQGFH